MVYDEVGAWSGRAHPRGAFEGMMLGSVSHAVIHGAGCAVAAVAGGQGWREETVRRMPIRRLSQAPRRCSNG